jgi:cytochrome bd-type quinol oxidase subunit 2
MKNVQLESARHKMAKIWFGGSAFPFMILVIQSIMGKYQGNVQGAFTWFIPTVFPTLTLMISVIGAAALKPRESRVVREGFLSITTWISIVYLSLLSLILLLQPVSDYRDPFKLFADSNFFIAPLQGICVAALGFLFTSDMEQSPDATLTNTLNNNP